MTATRQHPVVRSQVEPRLVERRQRVAAAERRSRRRSIGIVIGVAAFVTAVIGVAVSPLLAVSTIEVVGANRLSEQEVIDAAGLERGDRMVDLDTAAVRQAAMSEPLVASATVQRSWPSTVRIVVTEEDPVVRIFDSGTAIGVVTGTGFVVDPAAFDAEILPSLEIAGASKIAVGADLPERLGPAVAMVSDLDPALSRRLERALVGDDGAVRFEMSDGVTATLGSLDQIPAKLQALRTVLEQVDPTCMDTVDVSEPSRSTVTRRGGCTPVPVTDSAATEVASHEADAAHGDDADAGADTHG